MKFEEENRKQVVDNSGLFIKYLVRGLLVAFGGDAFAFLMYEFFLRERVRDYPDTARIPAIIFSLVFFSLTLFVTVRLAAAESPDNTVPDEKSILQNTYKEMNYQGFDFDVYFKDAVKKRLFAFPLAAFLAQLPLTAYYLILLIIGNLDQIYHLAFSFYPYFLPALFGYEITRNFLLGAVIFAVCFTGIYLLALRKIMKTWVKKPSYIQ